MTGDIRSKSDIFKAFEGHNIKAVIHVAGFGLAGTSNLPAFNQKTKEVNVNGTKNIIDACLNFNVKALGMYGFFFFKVHKTHNMLIFILMKRIVNRLCDSNFDH
jgi:hypothetical protein